jgi:aminoglycoside phosphotransferase (APT) family kinase protein
MERVGQTARVVVAEELLARVRAAIDCDIEYAEAPVRLGGGHYTANYRFSLNGAPASWARPMVLRLFPAHAPAGQDAWEVAVQTFVQDSGLPAPAVVLYEPETTIAGRRWFVMELLPGSPAVAGTGVGELIAGLPRMVRVLPRQTAEVHLALHRLDPAPLVAAFGESATYGRWLTGLEKSLAADDEHPLHPGWDWLTDNQPEPRSTLVLCHGDSWGGNLLVDHGRVTGIVDWTVAVVAEPALEVGFLTAALSLAAGVTRPLQHISRAVGRRLAAAYRSSYESGSQADLHAIAYYQALRCLLELNGVVAYRNAVRHGLSYDGPRPAWDATADQAVEYFKARTGVAIALGRR